MCRLVSQKHPYSSETWMVPTHDRPARPSLRCNVPIAKRRRCSSCSRSWVGSASQIGIRHGIGKVPRPKRDRIRRREPASRHGRRAPPPARATAACVRFGRRRQTPRKSWPRSQPPRPNPRPRRRIRQPNRRWHRSSSTSTRPAVANFDCCLESGPNWRTESSAIVNRSADLCPSTPWPTFPGLAAKRWS